MAIVAGGRHDQSQLQEGLAMDAIHVLSGHLRVTHFVFVRQAGVTVATRACLREIEFEYWRSMILNG